jgi:hypothetical protein
MSVQDFPLPLVEGMQGLGFDRFLKLFLSLPEAGTSILIYGCQIAKVLLLSLKFPLGCMGYKLLGAGLG